MKKNVTLKDIAERVGVSAVTVSKALSDKDGVSDEIRKTIKEVANELGYRYGNNTVLQCESGNIGVVIANRFVREDENAFYLKMYQNLVQALARYNFYGIMEIVTSKDEKELVMPKLLENNKVDGLILLGQFSSSYTDMLIHAEQNVLLLDYYDKKQSVDAIISDSVYGSYKATNYLISNGHKRIGFVGSIFATNSILDRYIGYYKALIESSLDVEKKWILEDRDEEGNLIEILLPDLNDMPTAFVCCCDKVCYILVKKLKAMGYKVPEDISVVGYDNFIFSTLSTLKFTTVDVDIEAMTEAAADLIIKKVRGQHHTTGMKIIESKLIIRESVCKVNNK
ncbi:LacI family DNA-binding transcriptional regulator [Anaeromicropila populeti]|uniref:Transcriptional regulator, LacI family n=1 Tax=Anaeromicropila populeti TaxID=37658 RepID=A0A1I6LMJ7_9FIRM|nr:LacI family DNA-binding transcriptional regulator [Anaeromicropila populeti]SFS04608.1 transcriptional regulator, LacI family [Anaeromicropila populeti]